MPTQAGSSSSCIVLCGIISDCTCLNALVYDLLSQSLLVTATLIVLAAMEALEMSATVLVATTTLL